MENYCIQCGNETFDLRVPPHPNHPKKFCSSICKARHNRKNVSLRLRVNRLPEEYIPVNGEIHTGTQLQLVMDYKANPGAKYIWSPCIKCKTQRWVELKKDGTTKSKYCKRCGPSAELAPNWKGGKFTDKYGYVQILLQKTDFYFLMTRKNRMVSEHRLVMARHLNRCLQPWEKVHHKNGVKTDNRIENFELTLAGSHSIQHSKGYRDGYALGLVDGRNAQIEELRKEIRLLHWQFKEAERL